ncbi:Methyl-CpG-binding domain-containing protein 8 [Abeliophyllum distichum]|uniref:Methyl-CpG-binding domain-containing protein 8 n=1 Tax=Abeliophyllum distichum TaxID=126358 RepID=A0ABD1SBC0_9LAMI
MASATVDSTTAADERPLQVPVVDLRLLSQSELYSLSQCYSSSVVGPLRCDDVIIKIDRSVFYESAGSRKQTYSRIRLAPTSSSSATTSSAPRHRTPHLCSTAVTNNNNGNSNQEKEENSQIIAVLKQLFVSNSNPDELIPEISDTSTSAI